MVNESFQQHRRNDTHDGQDLRYLYRGTRQNSNSFAGAALQAGKLPPATGVACDPVGPPGELLEFFAPGSNEPLRAPIGPRREPGEVARRSFDSRFGRWASSPEGATLAAEAGDPDALNGRFGNWMSVPVGDIRSPVLRALDKYRTSTASDGSGSASARGLLPATSALQTDNASTGACLASSWRRDRSPPRRPRRHCCGRPQGLPCRISRAKNPISETGGKIRRVGRASTHIRNCVEPALLFTTPYRVTLSSR